MEEHHLDVRSTQHFFLALVECYFFIFLCLDVCVGFHTHSNYSFTHTHTHILDHILISHVKYSTNELLPVSTSNGAKMIDNESSFWSLSGMVTKSKNVEIYIVYYFIFKS